MCCKSTRRCAQHAVHVRAGRASHSAGLRAEAAAARAGALTKLLLRMRELPGAGAHAANRASAEGMLAIAAMLLLGESAALPHPADADSVDRMVTCLQARARRPGLWGHNVFLSDTGAVGHTFLLGDTGDAVGETADRMAVTRLLAGAPRRGEQRPFWSRVPAIIPGSTGAALRPCRTPDTPSRPAPVRPAPGAAQARRAARARRPQRSHVRAPRASRARPRPRRCWRRATRAWRRCGWRSAAAASRP